MILMI
jgi:hypothetical protein